MDLGDVKLPAPERGLSIAVEPKIKWSPPPRPVSDSNAASPDPLTLDPHRSAVTAIGSRVRAFHASGTPFRIHHGPTNSTRSRPPPSTAHIDTSALSRILAVDTSARTILVEPNVPMDRLVEATLPHGVVPPVVTEFPSITAGGAYAGTAGESSSFRHGFFNETLRRVEMVLGTGATVTCSPTERADLFWGASGAVGSLGVVTALEIRLVPARRYVLAMYHPVGSVEEATAKVAACVRDEGLDYVDGIMFSATSGAVITGRMTDDVPAGTLVQRFSGASDPWFYLHVQDALSASARTTAPTAPVTEAIPLAEYLFRYDRGGFWVGREAFAYFRGFVPFARWTRRALDDFLHIRMMYAALHASGHVARLIVQDLALPFVTAPAFVRWADRATGTYPLWLCPLRSHGGPTLHPHALRRDSAAAGAEAVDKEIEVEKALDEAPGSEDMLLNVGLWGPGRKKLADGVALNRAIEAKVAELRGTKWLYAQTFYSESEFWSIYDRPWYDALRERYGATGLPSVWEKVRTKGVDDAGWGRWLLERWPIAAFWGIWKAIRSGVYKEDRRAVWKLM